MRKRLAKALIFAGLVWLTAMIADFGLTSYFRKETATKAGNIFSLKGRQDDFVILGNSRTLINAHADSIQRITGLKGYNLGLDGSNLMHQYLILENYFKTNHTKQVILNVDPWGMQLRLNKLQRVYPLVLKLDEDTIFHHLKSVFGRKVYIWKYIPMFKYSLFNSRLGIMAALGIQTGAYHDPINGSGDYMKVNTKLFTPKDKYKSNRILIRPEVMHYLSLIASLCKIRHSELKLYISPVYTPFYKKHQNIDSVNTSILKIINAPLNNFCDSDLCWSASNFYDHHHLNRAGRDLFTPMLARYIQSKP